MTATQPPHDARTDRPALVLRGLRKSFGSAVAVDGVDLEVGRGEFVTLLGPSGLRQDHDAAHGRRAS